MWRFLFILYTLSTFTAAAAIDTDALNAQQSFATFAYKNNPSVDASTLMIKAKKDTSGIVLRLDNSTSSPRNITISRKKHCADLTKKGSPNKQRCQGRPEPLVRISVALTPSDGFYTCKASVAPVNSQDALDNYEIITFSTKSADLARMAPPIVEGGKSNDSFTTMTYHLPQDVDGNTHSIRVTTDLADLPKFTISGKTNETTTFVLIYDKDAATPRSVKVS